MIGILCRSLPSYADSHNFGKWLRALKIKAFEKLRKVMQNDGKSAVRVPREYLQKRGGGGRAEADVP
jgi:hypothetical protein